MSQVEALMRRMKSYASHAHRSVLALAAVATAVLLNAPSILASAPGGGHQPGGEANLKLPDLSQVQFLGTDGHTLLLLSLIHI